MAHSRYDRGPGCTVEATLDVIAGRWKGAILDLPAETARRIFAVVAHCGASLLAAKGVALPEERTARVVRLDAAE